MPQGVILAIGALANAVCSREEVSKAFSGGTEMSEAVNLRQAWQIAIKTNERDLNVLVLGSGRSAAPAVEDDLDAP